nr:hypothetical protein [Nonomuraea lactucae]
MSGSTLLDRGHAPEKVHVQLRSQGLDGEVHRVNGPDRGGVARRRGVLKHVDVAEAGLDLIERIHERRSVGHVRDVALGAHSRAGQVLDQRVEGGTGAADQGDVEAFHAEPVRDRPAQSWSGAHDHGSTHCCSQIVESTKSFIVLNYSGALLYSHG